MKIKEIKSQNRRDFTAVYVCEHCGHEYTGSGYDDANFHQNVVPNMVCPKCEQSAPDTYRALAPKYAAAEVV